MPFCHAWIHNIKALRKRGILILQCLSSGAIPPNTLLRANMGLPTNARQWPIQPISHSVLAPKLAERRATAAAAADKTSQPLPTVYAAGPLDVLLSRAAGVLAHVISRKSVRSAPLTSSKLQAGQKAEPP